ncbi:hypothetical protein [Streptomyces sp. NPDC006925]|uniref:hypothetical protein n=1 Tax=Streptomyces sp. NPDC006925 TaxID=3364768 RepID=UPI00368CFA3B
MSGRHVRTEPPSRPGLAVFVLGVLGLTPPALLVGPQLVDARAAPVGIARPDAEPGEPADLAAGAMDGPASHIDCWGGRPTQ